nr:rifin PIR protein,putative [Plasmodium sp. DRC-Itaito]
MKLHYSKILLFFLTLNILLTSYQVNTHKKPHTTLHNTSIYTSRVLSEKDIKSSNYDKDTGMKSVMQQFVARTSQRLREYDERMKDKRQKRKEQRDKNIQKIVEKDKMEKSLADKIEKGCLSCGCALGGGVLPVWGLVSGLWYATLSQNVTKVATEAGIKKGLQVGLEQIFQLVRNFRTNDIPTITAADMLSAGEFTNSVTLFDMAQHIRDTMYGKLGEGGYYEFWSFVRGMADQKPISVFNITYGKHSAVVQKAFEEGKAAEFALHTSLLSKTIIASVVTILVIVLVMVIIYLILRYRRKKKMNKKAQYTKLLNK